MAIKLPNTGPIEQAAQSLQMQGGIPGTDLWQTPGIHPNAGGTGAGDGYLAHVARAMYDGRGAEIAAQSDGGDTDSAQDRAPRGADYGQAMGGILGRMGQLVPTETPEPQDDKWRQMRRLGLGMMAHGGPRGSGITGIGQAGLDVMEQNDAARLAKIEQQQASREAQREHLGTLYDHVHGEREYATERADTRADRRLERRRYESLDEYRRRQARTAGRRADAYADQARRRGRYYDARTAKSRGETDDNLLDSGEVMLRTGQPISVNDLNEIYRERYGEWDPEVAAALGLSRSVPTLEQFYRQMLTPETNPFRPSGRPPSYLDQIRDAMHQSDLVSGSSTNVDQANIPRVDYSHLWQ